MQRNVILFFTAACALGAATATANAKATDMAACFHDLEHGKGPDIVCEFPLQPSAAERAEMERQTAGYLKNAVCTVAINIARAQVIAALDTPDYQFDGPPQPVTCNVTMPGKTGDQSFPISGTFAPRVTIKAGVAVTASPGLGGVKGVSPYIALPVVAYINRAGFLRDGMLRVVNEWMAHLKATRQRAG